MKDGIGSIIALIGIIVLVFAQITGIGTWLYTWSTGVALGASIWAGFVIWMKMMGVGLAAFIVGMIVKD
jgi:hypothetical protein